MVNSLTDDKSLVLSKLKAITDNLNVTQNVTIIFQKVENIDRSGENVNHQHFLVSTIFLKIIFFKGVKIRLCVLIGC